MDYFDQDFIPWILLAWVSLYLFRPLSTLIHEVGHALIAAIFTKQMVQIKIGAGEHICKFSFMRVDLLISFKKMIFGHTSFYNFNLSKAKLLLILSTGPIFSALASYIGVLLIYLTKLNVAADAIIVGWICSHFLCFLRNVLPFHLQGADEKNSKGIPSDGLQIYRLLRQRFSWF